MTDVQRKSAPVSGRALSIIAVASAALVIAGCSSFKQSVGAAKQGPDETAIATRAPLVVPATFDLKPPQPGTPRPQDADTAAAAQRVLGAGGAGATPASEGEKALLSASGAEKADPRIRQELRQEVRKTSKRKSYADTVLFWRGNKVETGTPLDPADEPYRVNVAQPAVQPAPVIEKAEAEAAPAQAAAEAKEAEQKAEEDEKDDDSGGWFDWF